MIGPRNVGVRLNIEPEAVPVFYVNKSIWNKDYQDLIKRHTYSHLVCVVVDPSPEKIDEFKIPNRYVEFTFDCPERFDYFKEGIEKLL